MNKLVLVLLFGIVQTSFAQEPSSQPPRNAGSPIRVKAATNKNVFVGDEPIILTYTIFSLQGIQIEESSFNQDFSPFIKESIVIGGKQVVRGTRDVETQDVTIVVRLRVSDTLRIYTIPPFAIHYSYDEIAVGQSGSLEKRRRTKSFTTESIKLEKVPLYVVVNTVHEIVHIGDPVVTSLSVHVGSEAEILNELPPEKPQRDIIYLSNFSLEKPFSLLKREREETTSESRAYKIIVYKYTYSVLDIQNIPFNVPVPPVFWQLKGKPGDIKKIAPRPIQITVRSILEKGTDFEPQKGLEENPEREKTRLYILPLIATILIGTSLTTWGFWELVRFFKSRQKQKQPKTGTTPERTAQAIVYETSFFARRKLRKALKEALARYNEGPNEIRCANLRELLARFAVARLKGNKRIDRTAARSLTAAELRIIQDFPEIPIIRQLEICLETNNYSTIENSSL